MSIYRDSHRTPPNDVLAFVETVAKPRTITLSPDAAFALRTKARPANVLLNTTAKWVESLPSDVRPQALCARFPRIANALSSAWPDPEEAFAYFDELLLNGRRGRRGFSEDVLRELLAIQAYYDTEHALAQRTWECVT